MLLLVVLALLFAKPEARSPTPVSLVWSDPIPIAETTVATPPALVTAGGRLHFFWLDGSSGRVRLLHATADPSGRVHSTPQIIADRVDSRAGWPVAAAAGDRIAVAWMGHDRGGYALSVAVLDAQGNVMRRPAVVAPPAEAPGRVAIIPDPRGGWDVAWSQFTNPTRRVWFMRLDAAGNAAESARALADGDGAALAPGPRLFWWSPVGFDTYRLATAAVGPESFRARPLTGTISAPVVIPPIPLRAGDTVDVLLPILERGFATAGRLYLLRADQSGAAERKPVTLQSVLDVAAAGQGDEVLAVWSAIAGRRRNSEIFALLLSVMSGAVLQESRVSFTTEGSLRPAVVPLGSHWAVNWLEVAGEARFRLVLATTIDGGTHSFLLGIPELDLRRPTRLLTFGVAVAASILPYAGLFAVAFLLPALVLQALAAAVFGAFSVAAAIRARPWLRLIFFLAVVVVLQLPARALIPGGPAPAVLAVAMAVPAVAGAAVVSKTTMRLGELAFWVTAGAAVAIQMAVVLFPWGARLLSQF